MEKTAILIAAAIMLLESTAFAQDSRRGGPIRGRYIMTWGYGGEQPSDKEIDRIGISIEGDAAKTMYDALPAKEVDGSCNGDLMKSAGDFMCVKNLAKSSGDAPTYACSFGIMLDTGQTTYAFEC